MRFAANDGLGALRRGLVAAGLVALSASGASAQLIFDGNVLFNNIYSSPAQTLSDQFKTLSAATAACPVGYNAAVLGTTTFTHNAYFDPILPNALYQTNTIPNFQPSLGSPAFAHSVNVPADGFFEQTCHAGAIGPNTSDDWTQGWTYWDSTGLNRNDIHLVGMPDPRPLATYNNVSITSASQYFGPDSNYRVIGQLRVKKGAVLTVAPGVVVFEDRATVGTIVVERGGKVYAVGTQCDPIIITSAQNPGNMAHGDCGGIYLLGQAKTNAVNSCLGDSAAAEGGTVGYYGGNDDTDGSGVLRYVRVEYAGRERSPNNELNSFTMCAVGNRTHLDYCQSFQGDDDGFEWFGGTMDSKHLIAIDGHDDGYDTQMGTRNRSQFVIVRASAEYSQSRGQNGDHAIEADNTETSPYDQVFCSGRSFNQLANCTFIGDQRTDDGSLYPGPTFGVHWRRGVSYTLLNSIIAHFKSGALGIEHSATWDAHCAAIPANRVPFCGSVANVIPMSSGNLFVARSQPNPFRNQVNFSIRLSQSGPVSVEIYSADGRRVGTVAQGDMTAGEHQLAWKLEKDTPSGIYFYRVLAGNYQSTGKMTRLD
jgi:hypothetical protein